MTSGLLDKRNNGPHDGLQEVWPLAGQATCGAAKNVVPPARRVALCRIEQKAAGPAGARFRALTRRVFVRFSDMGKKAVILSNAEELRAARLKQRPVSSEELVAQRKRHRLASETFAAAARSATLKSGRAKVIAG